MKLEQVAIPTFPSPDRKRKRKRRRKRNKKNNNKKKISEMNSGLIFLKIFIAHVTMLSLPQNI
jgi:hypothetical protein